MIGIYFVITFFGQVAASAGPLPYDMAECYQRRQEYIQTRDKNFDAAIDSMNESLDQTNIYAGQKFTNKEQMQFYCIKSDHQPVLDEKFNAADYDKFR